MWTRISSVWLVLTFAAIAWGQDPITIAGRVLDPAGAVVPGAQVRATDGLGRTKAEAVTDDAGHFALQVPPGGIYSFVANAEGFEPVSTDLKQAGAGVADLELKFGSIQSVASAVTVTARVIEPTVDQRDNEIFNRTLFTRDDQIFQTLGAGINLGQHAGGGKSLEVRRFGFNLDHGGTGGGLKVMMDNIQQNQVSGGHAHGYLGALKGLSPELVEDVSLINGPFNAQYGDFSGLGVVNIRTRDQMPDRLTGRAQFGQFNTRRLFGAYSPQWGESTNGLVAFESSYSDGPFVRPLEYKRNNLTGAWARKLTPTDTLAFRVWGATNSSYSAGQLPLDEIEAGRLDRFGYIDPTDGVSSKAGTFAGYYTKEMPNGGTFKVDGMVNRLLFDLFSNFTFYMDPVHGDAFGQHDSRLQEALNVQYQRPHSWGGNFGTFTTGANYLGNQINLSLYGRQGRVPTDLRTWAHTSIANPGLFGQENLVMAGGKVRLDFGLRYDTFHFGIQDRMTNDPATGRWGGAWQPKAGFAYTPRLTLPFTIHANYGRAITSTNARALLQAPDSALTATTDFYQFGTSHNKGRFSAATSWFWIDRKHEVLYVADEGITEFTGPSRSYGWEAKTSVQISRTFSWNGSITKVMNAFYRGTNPREYIDRAPHFTAYSALTASNFHGWSGSLRMRAINHYILNGEESGGWVPGHTVFDFSVARSLNRWLELNFAVDNVLNKAYYETFERYTSRLQGQDPLERVHATPGYPRTVIAGLTIRLFPKHE